MIPLLALSLTAIGVLTFLLWQEKQDRRVEQDAWRLERTGLIGRIQRPEILPVEEIPEPTGEPLHIPLDDDEAYDAYREAQIAGEVR